MNEADGRRRDGSRRARRGSARVVVGPVIAGLGVSLLLVAAPSGCGEDARELFVRSFDAAIEADSTDEAGPEIDPTLGGPCTEDVQCDDQIPCTFDECDGALARCRNTPDDAQCADPSYCNGRETCVLRRGCAPAPVVTCQDDDPCTIDRCVEAEKSCAHEARDLDGDGDPDDHCVMKRDCDDLNPDIASTHSEICGNFEDDDCDGEIDEAGCMQPANDTCESALAVGASGTYLLSTIATKKDYATSCTVKTPSAAKDVVVRITVPGGAGGPLQDVELWANAQASSNEVALAIGSGTSCQAASEIGCGYVAASPSARVIARGVAPGTVLSAIVVTQAEGDVDLKVDIRAASPKPTNESCASPQSIVVGTPFVASLVDAGKDVPTKCVTSATGELTYSFSLPEPRDVRIFASTIAGSGEPVVSLRGAPCTSELRCKTGTTTPLFARSLAAGVHVLTVSATRPIDASVLVQSYPATPSPPTASCATAPPAALDTKTMVDLSAHEDSIDTGCLPGGSAAAYDLTLTQASDVLVIGRFPANDTGAVSLSGPGCTPADVLACSTGTTPQRVAKRNLAAGTYRVVIADTLGRPSELSALVRPAAAPTILGAGSDGCVGTVAIPAAGGFFTGDTTTASADFGAGCDAVGQPLGTARDQLLRLDLSAQRRVVFDMIGSFYATLLDIRQGTTCPGIEVVDACHVGAGPNRSFLDRTLGAGTYWVQIDGFSGDHGAWNLDVRVLPP